MASSPITTVLDVSSISPPPGSVPDTSVPLTSFDLPWFYFTPVHRLFFYRSTSPTKPFIQSLKSSLSLTLQIFYTLAGTIRRSPNSDDKVEIYYKDGDTIPFTLAESNDDFHELTSGNKRDYVTRILPLIPQLTNNLFAVQATIFPNHGVCIGVAVHHVVGDGSSIVSFLKSWASCCSSGVPPLATPIYGRTLVGDTAELYMVLKQQFPPNPVITTEDISQVSGATLASFTLGIDKITKLKERVRDQAENFHCSTFVVSCAYVWVCLVRALGYSTDRTAHFVFVMDFRRRMDPPVPTAYFGNCLTACFVEENSGVLMGDNGVVAASLAIGRKIEAMNEGNLRTSEEFSEKLRAFAHEKPLTVAGSPKLRVYDVDFGWGRPIRVEVPSMVKSGAISLAETRECDGGVEIGLPLEKGEIDMFEACFHESL